MRIFKANCFDNETGMELVLSECGYNEACWWIDSRYNVKYVNREGNLTEIICDNGFVFVYDEEREVLFVC